MTGFHRKHAIRALRIEKQQPSARVPRSRIYDEAVVNALTILWEAGARICGKRLKQAIPILVDAMERHQHIQLNEGGAPLPSRYEPGNYGSTFEAGSRCEQARTTQISTIRR